MKWLLCIITFSFIYVLSGAPANPYVLAGSPPVANRDSVTTTDNEQVSGNVLDNDHEPDGESMYTSLVTAPLNGSMVLNSDGSFTYTPNNNYTGLDSFICQVCDAAMPPFFCDTAVAIVNTLPINDKPEITVPASINVTEDWYWVSTITGISFYDEDAGSAGVSVFLTTATGTFNATSGSGVTVTGSGTGSLVLVGSITDINAYIAASRITYTTALNASGTVELTVDIDDNGATGPGGRQTASGTVSLIINPSNDSPNAQDDAIEVDENTPATGNVLTNDSDPEGNALTASLVTAPVNGTVVLNADGSFTYTPNSSYAGRDSLIYQVCDNGTPSFCDTATLRMNVGAVNDKPIVTAPETIHVTEDVASILSGISFSDADAGAANVTTTFTVAAGTLSAVAGGGVSVTGSGTGTVTLTGSIANINAFVSGMQYTSAANASGNVVMTVNIDDNGASGPGGNQTASGTVTLAIQPVNDAPVNTVPGAQTMNMNTTLTLQNQLAVKDIDSDNLQVTLSATHGSLSVPGVSGTVASVNAVLASITYTPDANYFGSDVITITTSDSYDTDTDIILIEIIGDTTPPTITGITRNDVTPTNAAAVSYTVSFSEKVTGVDASDFTLALTGTANGVISASGAVNDSTYHIQVTNLSGTGTLRLDSKGTGTGIADGFDNPLPAGIVTGEVYNIDHDAPAVTISAPATVSTPYTATVRFNESVTGFDTTGIIATNATISNLDETGAGVYTVLITPLYRGVVNISIPAGAARDAAGNNSKAAATVSTKVMANYVMDKIYPIPADTWITIRLKGIPVPEMHVLISDMTGRVVNKQFRQVENKMIKVNVGGLAAGTYVIIVRAAAFRHTQKISIGR